MTSPKLRFLLCCVLLFLGFSGAEAVDYIQVRGGLHNSFQRFAESQTTKAYTKITYFGGSITAGAGSSGPDKPWRALMHSYLGKQFPGATLAENNSAIGGTGSWLGAYRTRNQALYGGAALVIVEFAVNDTGSQEQQVVASMEGIVRQIWQTDPTTDILFVYTMSRPHLSAYTAGQLPPTVQWHERVAEHYGIPSVNMAQYAFDRIARGELSFDEFTADGVHPNDRGYALYFDALRPFIDQCKSQAAERVAVQRHSLPAPLSAAPMEKAQCVPYEWAKLEGDWKVGRKSPVEPFLHVLASDQPGATLSFRFKGSQCGIFDAVGPDCGNLEVSVDGAAWKPKPNWDHYAKGFTRAHSNVLAQNLDPAQWHEVKMRIAEQQPEESKGRFVRIGYLLVDGEVADPLKELAPLQRLDAVWDSEKQPLKMELSPDRWQQIPKTMERLKTGGKLRIVMLGDSIVGDTSSSKYELLLQRLYPNCSIEKITSIRSSTGCWWYKDENRVSEYVLKHHPDLLMIGGISQHDDTEAIRSVIQQVRAAQPCEVLLMTPAFGADTDPHIKQWHYAIDPKGDDYRAKLQRLASEEKCAFLDMTGPWWQFVQDSGCDYGYFRRDKVHSNERGQQILARILERYFAP